MFLRIYANEKNERQTDYADEKSLGKAVVFKERFREIVSDPINVLIERVSNAGYIDSDNNVILHNGIRVPIGGELAYYAEFSDILVINRGVHEPLEEYCFQELLSRLQTESGEHTMLELGAYWGHYSLWFSKCLRKTSCVLVEPEIQNLESGKENFANNGYSGKFINQLVAKDAFTVDGYMQGNASSCPEITLLHSDIQGYEEEMLVSSKQTLSMKKIKYLMISTHSKKWHDTCLNIIESYDYIVEVSSEPDYHSTSCDGFIFARRNDLLPIIEADKILGRIDIANATAADLMRYLNKFQLVSLSDPTD